DDLLYARLLLIVRQLRRRVGVERDECGDEGPAVTDHQRLRDLAIRLQIVLDVRRRDVLAARGDEDVLLAIGDRDEAVGIDLGDVARPEPAVFAQNVVRRVLVLEVAGEDGGAPNQQLAVLAQAY